MRMPTFCDYCGHEMEPGREFVYHMESLDFVDDEATLEWIHNSAQYHGEPLRLCVRCQKQVEANRRDLEAEREEEKRTDKFVVRLVAISLAILAMLLIARYWVL